MRLTTGVVLVMAVALSSAPSYAEVYKTTDEQGNTVFTDVPPEAGAQQVQVHKANIADSVEVPEYEAPQQSPVEQRAQQPLETEEAVEPSPEVLVDDDPDIVPVVRRRSLEPVRRPVVRPVPHR